MNNPTPANAADVYDGEIKQKVVNLFVAPYCMNTHARLYEYMRDLLASENVFLEPSAYACFQGPVHFMRGMKKYIADNGLETKMKNASHIVWATGGSMVPEDIREKYRNTYLRD